MLIVERAMLDALSEFDIALTVEHCTLSIFEHFLHDLNRRRHVEPQLRVSIFQ